MVTRTVVIPNMNNEQDAAKVSEALREIWGIQKVDINLSSHEAIFSYDEASASLHDFQEAILELGFDIVKDNGVRKESMHEWNLERSGEESLY